MNKKRLHHFRTRLLKINYWVFLAAFLLSATIAVFALRQNNLNAISLRDELIKVDEQNGDVESAIDKLRLYIYGHMNTDLASSTSVYPPIQLKHRYDRLVAAEKERTGQANTNTIYNDAQKYCETHFPQSFYGAGRLPCIQNYIDSHPAPSVEEKQIPDALFKFNFSSPVWSPDLAGWSLFFAALFLFMFTVSFVLEKWLHHKLRNHQ